MAKAIPWAKIKKDYVVGHEKDGRLTYPSQRELAAKYQVDPSTIAMHCKREDWLSERQIVSSKIQAKSEQKTIEQISDKGVDFDLKCFKQAQNIQQIIEKKISDASKPQEIAMLVRALKDNQSYAKEALGENTTTDNQQKIVVEIVK